MLRVWYILALVCLAPAAGDLVINEIDVDQIGTDRVEFIEVYNAGATAVAFSAEPHVLVFFNGGDETPPVFDGSYRAVDLAGVVEPGSFLVVGVSQTPLVDILIPGGEANLVQNGTDAVALYRGSTLDWIAQAPPTTAQLVDALVYHTDDEDDLVLRQSLGVTERYDEWNGQGSVGVVFSIARDPDGGTFHTGATPTPGRSNDADPPVFAIADATLLQCDATEPAAVTLRGEGGLGALTFRVLSLPVEGTLFDDQTPITGAGTTALPHTIDGEPSYLPAGGYNGVERFEFDVVDALGRTSEPAIQELVVQLGGVVITEIMHSPGTFSMPQDQRVYEYVEVFNYSNTDIALTRLDTSLSDSVDTTDNLLIDGVPPTIPARTMRIIAPGGLSPASNEQFTCEWGLEESDIIRVPHERYENMFVGSRLLLYGAEGVLLDAVNLAPEDFWWFIPAASQSVKEAFLEMFGVQLDAAGNDILALWPYTGLGNMLGFRISYSGIGQGSPGFIPADYNEDFTPLPECVAPPLGACCLPNGQCAATSLTECDARGGAYLGDHMLCDPPAVCPEPPMGACCTPPGDCWFIDADTCSSAAGTYDPDAEVCDLVDCPVDLQVVINELDYTQQGIDTSEYMELYGRAGLSLFGYRIVLYNGAPQHQAPYRSIDVAGFIPDDGFFVIGSPDVANVDQSAFTVDGIQDGSPDGIALIDSLGVVIEAIAYGGSFIAADGPAAGVLFEDVGVEDASATGESEEVALQRIPNGTGPWRVTTDGGLGPDGTPGTLNVVPLPAPHGACCLPDGFCLEALEAVLCVGASGTYGGDASLCTGDCPILIGACCLPNGNCTAHAQSDCDIEGGAFAGVGVQCSAAPPCLTPLTGACCLSGGGCIIEDLYDCTTLSGDYRGHGSNCAAANCGVPRALGINEIYRNDESIDDLEFIELFGPGGASLEGHAVVVIEGDYSAAGQQGRIDKVWPLGAFSIPGDGRFVIGDDAVHDVDFPVGSINQLENGTATILLIEDFDVTNYPAGYDIDEDNDGEADAGVALGLVVDGLAFVDSGIDAEPPAVDRTYFDTVIVGPQGAEAPAGVARRTDGLNTGSPTDFCTLSESGDGSDGDAVPTPGAVNTCATCAIPGDGNADAIVDLLDFHYLQSCFTGSITPGAPPVYPTGCRCFDLDIDGDIDLADYSTFHQMTNSGAD